MSDSQYWIVVDVESTCWEGKAPLGQLSEIIEIGVCRFDLTTRERSDPASLLVKPCRSQVSPFCTQLTTLTPAMLEDGMSFEAACQMLRQTYASAEHPWVSWGAYDRKMFQSQCQAFGVEYPFGPQHLNLKAAFARLHNVRPMGMAGALAMLGLPLEGTHHRGGDDAWNIALILNHTLQTFPLEAILEG
jgi:inhibitor of KinA sporulation pathway (predicted exonuclease)